MLVLSRKRREALVIGDQMSSDEIRITVLKVQGDVVRLGIEAPPHIAIHRDEVHERIQKEQNGLSSSLPTAAHDAA